jgi:hypothetical protein
MNCRQFHKLLPELEPDRRTVAAPAGALEHVRDCLSCAALFERHQELRAGLRQMAAQQAASMAPARVEAILLNQFRLHAETAREKVRAGEQRQVSAFAPLPGGILGAGALAAALAAFLLWLHPPGWHAVPGSSAVAMDAEDTATLESDFIPLPYFGNSGLFSEAAADADVLRVEMPRSTLVALGVAAPEDNAPEAVEAELLLGAGGMPQAVRVLE